MTKPRGRKFRGFVVFHAGVKQMKQGFVAKNLKSVNYKNIVKQNETRKRH